MAAVDSVVFTFLQCLHFIDEELGGCSPLPGRWFESKIEDATIGDADWNRNEIS